MIARAGQAGRHWLRVCLWYRHPGGWWPCRPRITRLRVVLVFLFRRCVLGIQYVLNGCFEAPIVVEEPLAASFGPPMSTYLIGRSGVSSLVVFELSRAPRFELVSNGFGVVSGSRHHDVNVVASAIHGMQKPTADLAMSGNRVFDDVTLPRIQRQSRFDHCVLGSASESPVWHLESVVPPRPTTIIAREPSPIRRLRQEVAERIIVHDHTDTSTIQHEPNAQARYQHDALARY